MQTLLEKMENNKKALLESIQERDANPQPKRAATPESQQLNWPGPDGQLPYGATLHA